PPSPAASPTTSSSTPPGPSSSCPRIKSEQSRHMRKEGDSRGPVTPSRNGAFMRAGISCPASPVRGRAGPIATERSADDRSSGQIDSSQASDRLSVTVPVALRASTLAALVVLLLQYGLGIDANLYATLPASDHGKSI